MPFLTVFTTPKPFKNDHIATIQCNAIRSWLALPDVDVIVIGRDEGVAETARELGAAYYADVQRNQSGTPLVSSIFSIARQHNDNPVLAYVNADMILLEDFVETARQVSAQRAEYLVVGRRWNMDISEPLDFQSGWQARLRQAASQSARLQTPTGSDYFIFPRTAYQGILDFAIGRAGWDNWMIYHAVKQGWVVVDATQAVLAIHQNHDYSHLPGGKPHYGLAESQLNVELAGGPQNMYSVLEASHLLLNGRLTPPPINLLRLVRKFEIAVWDGKRQGWRWKIVRRARRLRRRILETR